MTGDSEGEVFFSFSGMRGLAQIPDHRVERNGFPGGFKRIGEIFKCGRIERLRLFVRGEKIGRLTTVQCDHIRSIVALYSDI